MYFEQSLHTCTLCFRALALQYQWHARRIPSSAQDRVTVKSFKCPGCGYVNVFITLLYASGFQLKVVPGPEAWVPFPRHLPSTARAGDASHAASSSNLALLLPGFPFAICMNHTWLQMILAWWVSHLLPW